MWSWEKNKESTCRFVYMYQNNSKFWVLLSLWWKLGSRTECADETGLLKSAFRAALPQIEFSKDGCAEPQTRALISLSALHPSLCPARSSLTLWLQCVSSFVQKHFTPVTFTYRTASPNSCHFPFRMSFWSIVILMNRSCSIP